VAVDIEDYPRFPWRGAHLDVGRHFMPKEFVKKYIDLIALHKLNTFHWHLTEDQGWRLEIKQYPKLTEVGAWRKETLVGRPRGTEERKFDGKRHGGFYTQEDAREIVAYAQARFVTVVPEIEMPGHSVAAIASYPELGVTGAPIDVATSWGVFSDILNAKPSTIQFMQNVLTEVMAIFPGRYIHIGGDEADKTKVRRRTAQMRFVAGPKPNQFRGLDPLEPFAEKPAAWAYIDQNTLIVHILSILYDGNYELQTYERSLSGNTMTLHFSRLLPGRPELVVSGQLQRQPE